jgi:hypothetical protein
MTYGISCESLIQGTRREEMLNLYFERREKEGRREQESRANEEALSGLIAYPNPGDGLIGRGHPYHDFSGSRRLFKLIDSESARYGESSDRFWKTCVTLDITQRFQESNGRFLQRTKSGWKELDINEARIKVNNLFRYKKNLKNGNTAARGGAKRRKAA